MNFDDHDWELGNPPAADVRGAATLWKIAAGVAVGMVLGGVLVYALDRRPASTNTTASAPAIERLLRGAEPTAAGNPPRTPPAAAPLTARPLPDQLAQAAKAEPESAVEAAQAAAVVDSQREQAAQRASQRAAERKDKAWAMFYQKPSQCDENPTKAIMVECANHYIRARREFEESYGAGKR